jgi:hypothetical protein
MEGANIKLKGRASGWQQHPTSSTNLANMMLHSVENNQFRQQYSATADYKRVMHL